MKSVKQCLKKVIGNARLSFDEMLTVLVEVEGTLNSRPLTYGDDNPSEEVLTPSHSIHGRRIHSLPEVLESEEEFGDNSICIYVYVISSVIIPKPLAGLTFVKICCFITFQCQEDFNHRPFRCVLKVLDLSHTHHICRGIS